MSTVDHTVLDGRKVYASHHVQAEGSQHLRIVLCLYHDEWVTWVYNQQGGFSHGHYFKKDQLKDALNDFSERVRKYEGIS